MELYARDLGGEGPPLIILHGLLGSSRNWQRAGADLANGRHVVALDLRNHGESPAVGFTSIDDLASDVLEWLGATDSPPATVLGHSLGGKVAMWLATRHPARVRGLVIVDVAPRAYPPRPAAIDAMVAMDLASLRSRKDADERLSAVIDDRQTRQFLLTNLERTDDGGFAWRVDLPAIRRAMVELRGWTLGEDQRYDGPALLVRAARSSYVTDDDVVLTRRHFPALQVATTQTGHNPHTEDRAGLVSVVGAFLDSQP